MKVVFGINRIKLKEYSINEFDYFNEKIKNAKITKRVNYFHLFWIPFFPVGTKHYLENNGNLFEITKSLPQEIKDEKIRAPWYSYIGLILTPFVTILYLGYELYISNRISSEFDEINNAFIEKIENPKINDYYQLSYQYNPNVKNAIDVIKVEDFKTDSILFGIPIKKEKDVYHLHDIEEYFNSNPEIRSSWISKEKLKTACTSFDVRKAVVIPQIHSESKYYIQDIHRK